MKKQLWMIALLAFCILLGSCEKQPNRPMKPPYEKITSSELSDGEVRTGTVPGDYIYRAMHVSNKSLLLKYQYSWAEMPWLVRSRSIR